ncbi:hypothetical protein PUV54_07085 [Hyphococcus flavus]|uniref:Uncharacterized protein n=1 Tax=Hyphococcus flavus TaxID=1866326 RepID=A0AAE9ZFM9_9PROT|nr:XrtV sorting system accessory protein [Hyphococcus flavus]WDI32960.1 hypothetical protein PUV54_07085 [Hyphococcus flavus]
MESIYDLLSLALFIAAAGLFMLRFRHEDPPLAPYLVIALVSVVGNWLGNNGGGVAAVALMMAAAFLTLHLASQPYHDDPEESSR